MGASRGEKERRNVRVASRLARIAVTCPSRKVMLVTTCDTSVANPTGFFVVHAPSILGCAELAGVPRVVQCQDTILVSA